MDIRTSSFVLFTIFHSLLTTNFAVRKSYVVYLGGHSHSLNATSADYDRVTDYQIDFLGSILGSKERAKKAIFYSYQKYINGFAANLEEEDAKKLSKHPRVLSVFLNKANHIHTTRSWGFLRLERENRIPSKSIWRQAKFGEATIIGNIDTGVWPESESFSDEGMGPIPSRWKGICEIHRNDGASACNRKLIGARYMYRGYESLLGHPPSPSLSSARDFQGHGTHTLSIAAGRFVCGANVFGYGNGTAKGGSPMARVAAYKACWPPIDGQSCFDADVMAAFEAAIHDGVEVISVSIAAGSSHRYFENAVAIGSFHAVRNGITVVASAGNAGPAPGTVVNVAPWIFTVAASNMDREFPSYLHLGNNKRYKGQSLSAEYLPEKLYPLISALDAKAANATEDAARLCNVGSLDRRKVKGKIVLCLRGGNDRVEKGEIVRKAGGVGMIIANTWETGDDIVVDTHVLPATHIAQLDGDSVLLYIKSTKTPMAHISRPWTDLGTKPAPVMAAFSSRGPNPVTPEILKPDITAPGVGVLAAHSEAADVTPRPSDVSPVRFRIDSGTSMSCPHVAGIAGLLKTLHPDWSPAAIRSAIMTTAKEMRSSLASSSVEATPLSYGAGHVRPNRAMNPGLIYDLTDRDYLNLLCATGYNSTQMATFVAYNCPSKKISILDLNYPSITIPYLVDTTTIRRRVKNVGPPSTYTASVHPPPGIAVSVLPKSLRFEKMGEEKRFKIVLKPKKDFTGDYVFGRLTWSDGVHKVRSPIVVSSIG